MGSSDCTGFCCSWKFHLLCKVFLPGFGLFLTCSHLTVQPSAASPQSFAAQPPLQAGTTPSHLGRVTSGNWPGIGATGPAHQRANLSRSWAVSFRVNSPDAGERRPLVLVLGRDAAAFRNRGEAPGASPAVNREGLTLTGLVREMRRKDRGDS